MNKKCKVLFLLILFLFSCPLHSAEKKTICLNMIVKNEKDVICTCLNSVKPIINYWVIVDTGSTDDTKEIIKECMKDIPGELHESPWKNFEHNRNEALNLAKGKADYCLIMDADDFLKFDQDFQMPQLTADAYQIHIGRGGFTWDRIQLINMHKEWSWKGVLHEYLVAPPSCSSALLEKVLYVATIGGARSKDPKKYEKDAAVLEEALLIEPTNSRYMFYLAQSYRDAENPLKALIYYQKRFDMGGWDEETYVSLVQIADLKKLLKKPIFEVIGAYFTAYCFRPTRGEALYELCDLLNNNSEHAIAYGLLKANNRIQKLPKADILLRIEWMENWGLLFQLSISAYHVRKYQESLELCDALLARSDLPENYRNAVQRNRKCALDRITEQSLLLKK